ncbi:MAG: hypothetical protein ACKOED_01860 [Aestuariivirga sp.]|uniref:hypothetical protein n=1 Tax=Aestuariivirga sp. TaxID=2650926 RepID=UPI0038D1E2C3
MKTAETELAARLAGIPDAQDIAWAAVWLEACGYGGIKLLADALTDGARSHDLARDALGIDLQNISCAFLAPAIMRDVKANGRVFLRNVRHGLFMLPFTVRDNIGLGCPIDPSFAVGGERLKNPYAEKLALAEAEGLDIDETAWAGAQA